MRSDVSSGTDFDELSAMRATLSTLAQRNAALVEENTSLTQCKVSLTDKVAALQHQIDWFRRQLFGAKSERLLNVPDPRQLHLGEALPVPETQPEVQAKPVAPHVRRPGRRDFTEAGESLAFFDETKVPVVEVRLPTPEIEGLAPDQYEVIDDKVSYRLAQRPASYLVMRYLRAVVKLRESGALVTAPAPAGVLEGSRADVSLCAGLLVDKFVYHQPLYRQHQRMTDAGLRVSRPWLTQLAQQIIALLEPIHEAQLASIRASRVIAMDETPIKAGRERAGKMKQGYFWPVYGEHDEISFPFSTSRAHAMVVDTLGVRGKDTVLLSDGYAAYQRYATQTGVTHAQCWAHCRREFYEAQAADPAGCGEALRQIGVLYEIESQIRERKLAGESKRLHRLTHSKPVVEQLYEWIDLQFERTGLLPSSPFTKALAYARERRVALSVFLTDPDVPMDTNHLERGLRAIPMGRRNWLFCWTELGAKQVGIVQSLLVTCRLHGIDPYTYLVDVLQRVGEHPQARVAELTPRRWKELFAANPMRSDLHAIELR